MCRNVDEDVQCGGSETESFYLTGSTVAGGVRNLTVLNSTEDKITISFEAPERIKELSDYEISATALRTFSTTQWATRNQTWKASKNILKFDITNLIPSTQYSIRVTSKNGDVEGGESGIVASTKIGKPDPPPETPEILEQTKGRMKIKIKKAENNNGPVSRYRIVVHYVDDELIPDFDENLLGNYQKSQDDGLSYYIAGEIDAFRDPFKTFVVGDGRRFGKDLYNAPLIDRHLHILIGVISEWNNQMSVAYSDASHHEEPRVMVLTPHNHHNHRNEASGGWLVAVLTFGCIILGIVLLASIGFYGYLRFIKVNPGRRRFERHEMSLQGPILEVDNNGFISDMSGVNFKEKLQETLLSLDDDQKILRKNLSLDIDNILAIGDFGDVIKGQLHGTAPTQVHVVSADDMDPPVQIKFIRDMNNLLQFGFHKNMLSFLGICQTHDWFFVVFEDTPATLKQFLIAQRDDQNLNNRRLTNFSEELAVKFMLELSETMEYLKYNKIVHKNLNSHHVRVKRQNSTFTIKLTFFGPTFYIINEDGTKSLVDDDRWFAPEVMRFQKFSHQSDVYSLGLVMWEICCVGGTVYGSIPSSDLLPRVKKGFRPEKYQFISEDLYQLMLNCWEIDPQERCDFTDIVGQMKHLQLSPQYYLNYALEGPLPYYLPLIEIKT